MEILLLKKLEKLWGKTKTGRELPFIEESKESERRVIMKCEVVRDLLPLYIDKLTSEESNKEIEKHLKNCKECYQYYQEMMGEIGVLAEIPKEEAEDVKVIKKIKKTNITR